MVQDRFAGFILGKSGTRTLVAVKKVAWGFRV